MDLSDFKYLLDNHQRILFAMPMRISSQKYALEYEKDAETILTFVEKMAAHFGLGMKDIIHRYDKFIREQANMQHQFLENGCYQYHREEQIESIINNREFQIDNIFILSLSYVLAPHRYELFRYVRSYVQRTISAKDRCLEIGTGTGFDSAMVSSQGTFLDTYDLNPYSSDCLKTHRVFSDVEFHPETYGFNDIEKYDHCILIEILEHVEKPLQLLQHAYMVLKKGGSAILTFAIRMPQIDHIYLFNSVSDAREMIAGTKFNIVEQNYFISSFMNVDDAKRESLAESSKYAANYVCTVRKPALS